MAEEYVVMCNGERLGTLISKTVVKVGDVFGLKTGKVAVVQSVGLSEEKDLLIEVSVGDGLHGMFNAQYKCQWCGRRTDRAPSWGTFSFCSDHCAFEWAWRYAQRLESYIESALRGQTLEEMAYILRKGMGSGKGVKHENEYQGASESVSVDPYPPISW